MVITITKEERAEYFRRYGIPNAVDVGYGIFGGKTGSLFVDDFNNGEPVAYLPYFEQETNDVLSFTDE
jgi:hypothetical protein